MNAFGRSLKNVYSLLSKGEKARAYEVLKNIEQSSTQELVDLANAYSHFEMALKKGRSLLLKAKETDSTIAATASYRSIDFLYKVLEKQDVRIDSRIMTLAANQDELVRFNIGRALFLSANYKRALRVLSNTKVEPLNEYLQYLRLSLIAASYANTSKFLLAAETYQQIIFETNREDYSEEKLLLAECYLQASEPELAIQSLDIDCNNVEQEKRLFYLRGVGLHHLTRYQEAFIELKKSYLLYHKDAPYELLLAIARLNIDLQKPIEASEYYERTLATIPEHHKQQITHEYARFLKDYEQYREASVLLKELANDMRYQHKIVAELDLAEIAFEMKDVQQAKIIVQRPYNQGLLGASILLARIAMDSYDYDDAIVYLEQVLATSKKASFEWLSAQVLLAEAFAKKKSINPDRLIMHAENALDYLQADDDWTMTLESYLEEARAEARENRVVN